MKTIKNFDPKEMDDNFLKNIFKEIVKTIKKKPVGFFKFKKMRSIRGLWCSGDDILIDHRREIIPTIIHEMLHDIYVDNSETWVCRIESKITQTINTEDICILLNAFLEKVEINSQ